MADSDRQPFAELNADPRVMEFMPGLLSREASDELADRIEREFEQNRLGLFAAELRETRTFIGFVGINVPGFEAPFMPLPGRRNRLPHPVCKPLHSKGVKTAVEIGWRLAAEHWGRGLATEGAREVLRFGFEIVGLLEIVSFTVPDNWRSRRVMEKIGMTHDSADDFEHPRLAVGHPLRPHVLYRLRRMDWVSTAVREIR